MTALQQLVRRTIRRHNLCPPGSRVLVGVSGGSDSVALTFLLTDLAAALGFSVAGLAHLNHQLRPNAGRDEAFCRDLAERLGQPIHVGSVSVQASAEAGGFSIEDAARRERYAFLARTASHLRADRVAVGHTSDDQAETFVLKLLRGAGADGLGGIYPRRGEVIRPLLEASRNELRVYLKARGEGWVEDETNADVSNPRNRIRHEVLPYLERALGLPASRAIARAAGLVGADAILLDEMAEARLGLLMVTTPVGVELDADMLRAEPAPLARRILLKALRGRAAGKEVGLEHVQAVVDVLAGVSAATEVPACRVELRGKKLVLLQ